MLKEIKKTTKRNMSSYQRLSPFLAFLARLKMTIKDWLFNTSSIIIYHRIANVNADPNQLCVSPDIFEQQLIYLKENFEIIRLSELAENVKNKQVRKKTVAITFDDGYADNLTMALPILEKLQIPATIYIVAGKIDENTPFYWDEKTAEGDRGHALTKTELKNLAESSLIEIGAHTVSHPKLSSLSKQAQTDEIEQSKKKLEEIIRQTVISFSYPFGSRRDFNSISINLVKKTGYQYACANIQDRVTNYSDPYALPRLLVRNNLKDFQKIIGL